jgi:hypothetical protein
VVGGRGEAAVADGGDQFVKRLAGLVAVPGAAVTLEALPGTHLLRRPEL